MSVFIIAASGVVYCLAYVIRYNIVTIELDNSILDWFMTQSVLFGTSQFTYMIGMVCRKHQLVSKMRNAANKIYFRIALIAVSVCILLVHCVIQSVFLAPFTALATLSILAIIKLPNVIQKALCFLGKHSTNIWLVHMFFYMGLFDGFVFIVKWPLLVLVFMFSICVAVSLFINVLCHPLCKIIAGSNKYKNKNSKVE